MSTEKTTLSGGTTMLIMKLLEEKDMYGYQIIEELSRRSENIFRLKTGTLYPLLHGLEKDGLIISYDEIAENGRERKYYRLTDEGGNLLFQKHAEWKTYSSAVNRVMKGGKKNALA